MFLLDYHTIVDFLSLLWQQGAKVCVGGDDGGWHVTKSILGNNGSMGAQRHHRHLIKITTMILHFRGSVL